MTRIAIALLVALVVVGAQPAAAQTPTSTFVLSDTVGRFTFNPSLDHNATFGTPPAPVLTNYWIDFFLQSAVTNIATCASTPTTPAFSVDLGKPAPVAGLITTTTIKSLFPAMLANTSYYACLRASGPGGSSPRSNVDSNTLGAPIPFGFPSSPGTGTAFTVAP